MLGRGNFKGRLDSGYGIVISHCFEREREQKVDQESMKMCSVVKKRALRKFNVAAKEDGQQF